MGRPPRSPLTAALFSSVQERVLGLLFADPSRSFAIWELVGLAGSGTGAVQRQIQRLTAAGIVEVTRTGNQKRYKVRQECPIFPELHGIVQKTIGLVEPLRAALAPLRSRISLAFVFGSVARGRERAGSDIDLFLVSDDLGYAEIYSAILPVEKLLGRPIHPTVMSPREWKQQRSRKDSFADRVATQPRLFVVGDADDRG